MRFKRAYISSWANYMPSTITPVPTNSIGIISKVIAATDEDSLTMAYQASQSALNKTNISKNKIGALYVGSESHPYAVKPQITLLQNFLNLPNNIIGTDMQFACRVGMDSVIVVSNMVEAKTILSGIAIGSDKAQVDGKDILDYSAAAGASSWIITNQKKEGRFQIVYATSYISDTPDFWRHQNENYPRHAGRFTGEPAYMYHLQKVFDQTFQENNLVAKNIKKLVIHAPNGKFPKVFAARNGMKPKLDNILAIKSGNPYSASVMIQAVNTGKKLKKNEYLLLLSYGSGAGSIAMLIKKV